MGSLNPALPESSAGDPFGGVPETSAGICCFILVVYPVPNGPEIGLSGRGLSFSLVPTYGASSSGADGLWSAADAHALAPDGAFEPESRLEAEFGYGLGLGGGFTGTPNLGLGLSDGAREYRIGWRLTPARGDAGFQVSLDAMRRGSANGNGAGAEPEHGVLLRLQAR